MRGVGERMRAITMMQAQWRADSRQGESLTFQNCKGGYFSVDEKYALKVIGKTAQSGVPTPESPCPLDCVKSGTVVRCGEEQVSVPCDLYQNDIWYPTIGKAEKYTKIKVLDGSEAWMKYPLLAPTNDVSVFYCLFSDAKIGFGRSKCNYFANTDNGDGYQDTTASVGLYADHEKQKYKYFGWGTATSTVEDFKSWLSEKNSAGESVILAYEIARPIVQEYASKTILAPSGTVTVTQEATKEPAELSATMPVRR